MKSITLLTLSALILFGGASINAMEQLIVNEKPVQPIVNEKPVQYIQNIFSYDEVIKKGPNVLKIEEVKGKLETINSTIAEANETIISEVKGKLETTNSTIAEANETIISKIKDLSKEKAQGPQVVAVEDVKYLLSKEYEQNLPVYSKYPKTSLLCVGVMGFALGLYFPEIRKSVSTKLFAAAETTNELASGTFE